MEMEFFKEKESVYSQELEAQKFNVIRLDGRSFSKYTKNMDLFDRDFINDMNETAIELCKEISGTIFGYVQSDEISIVFTDRTENENTQLYFGGKVSKILSIASSVASRVFNKKRLEKNYKDGADFDCRVFQLDSREMVDEYINTRRSDAFRNSVNRIAMQHFSHKDLQGISTAERVKMLNEKGVDVTQYDYNDIYGRLIRRSKQRVYNEYLKGEINRNIWIIAPWESF